MRATLLFLIDIFEFPRPCSREQLIGPSPALSADSNRAAPQTTESGLCVSNVA